LDLKLATTFLNTAPLYVIQNQGDYIDVEFISNVNALSLRSSLEQEYSCLPLNTSTLITGRNSTMHPWLSSGVQLLHHL